MHARVVYLGWEKVSCLECPQFRSVLIGREVPLYIARNNTRGSCVSLTHLVQLCL